MKSIIKLKNGLQLENGEYVNNVEVAFKQYGTPKPDGSNVIIICHTLSGGINILEQKEWWFVDTDEWIDPRTYCIFAFATLGSWHGSSSPANNSFCYKIEKSKIYFPTVTVTDSIRAHREALRQMGVNRVKAVIGGSFGGFCAYTWITLDPNLCDVAIVFQSSLQCSAHSIGLFSMMRELICNDDNYRNGDYKHEDIPRMKGLRQAIGLNRLFALSHHYYEKQFPPNQRGKENQIEAGYWEHFSKVDSFIHQAPKSLNGVEPKCLLSTLRASSLFDLNRTFPKFWESWKTMKTGIIHIPCRQDWRYPTSGMERIHQQCRALGIKSALRITESEFGHGSFLHDKSSIIYLLPYLNKVTQTGDIDA